MLNNKYLKLLLDKHVIVAICSAILAFITIIILSNEISKISDSIVSNKKIERNILDRATHLEQVKYQMNLIGNNDVIMNNAFVPSDNIAPFITSLEGISLKNSVTQVFKFDSPIDSKITSSFPISTVTYNNSLTATLPNLIKYMKDFEHLKYFTKIDGFTMSSQTSNGINDTSNISLQASLYTKSTQ